MYRVKTVAEMLGVPRNTLIAWERRLGIVDPERTDGGYRAYSDADVDRLRRLRDLVASGLKVSEAWALMQRDQRAPVAPVVWEPELLSAMGNLRSELGQRLLAFDREGAERAAIALLMVPFEAQLEEVFYPMLTTVGEEWAAGRVSIAQEHFVSAWVRERLLIMLHAVSGANANGPEITCATPAGETHELGLIGLAVRLALRQFRVVLLGADVPIADLVRHAEERQPYGICLSMVQARPVSEIAAYLRDLRRRVPTGVRLAVGGRATALAPILDVPGVAVCGNELPPWADTVTLLRKSVG